MSLTNLLLKNSKPKDKQYKLPDGQGLHILIHPNEAKYWQLRYYFQGKQKLLNFGKYPEINLVIIIAFNSIISV